MSKKTARTVKDDISRVPFIGKSRARSFKRLGIFTVEDLLLNIPKRVVDFRNPTKISYLKIGDKKPILAKVSQIKQNRTFKKRMIVTRALLSDDSGSIEAVWFNQPYLMWAFKKGKRYLFWGEVRTDKYSNRLIYSNPQFYEKSGVYPIYSQTKDLTSRQISRAVKNAIDTGYRLEEYLPDNILKKNNLPNLNAAVCGLHFPDNIDGFIVSKNRIVFNKLLELILANLLIKKENSQLKSERVDIAKHQGRINKFISDLPFDLTAGQAKAAKEILSDLQKEKPMNRVVQGDVGSGKTIVGILASLPVVWSGKRVVWLVPTQVLAHQHYNNIKKLIGTKTRIALVTSSVKKNDTKESDLIIGTHALMQKKMQIDRLGLIVVDEQHRFGVEQREALIKKGRSGNAMVPHFLSLTATPIPRTLSHIVFGNCDISIIKSKPTGRKKIKTFVIPEEKRDKSYKFISKLIELGQKAFIICPAIGEELDPEGDKKAVIQEFERVKATAIGKFKVGMLHGQMKTELKEKTFLEFALGKMQVLISTSVVEVGVDIPEATVMIVEDAHNFGLAQLHQFRGRVGRSDLQSYCFCFSHNLDNHKSKERLRAFVQTDDGFKLAQYDLKLRGPGALLGLEQSGFSGLSPVWLENTDLILTAKTVAQRILPVINSNKYLYNKVKTKLKTGHLE